MRVYAVVNEYDGSDSEIRLYSNRDDAFADICSHRTHGEQEGYHWNVSLDDKDSDSGYLFCADLGDGLRCKLVVQDIRDHFSDN